MWTEQHELPLFKVDLQSAPSNYATWQQYRLITLNPCHSTISQGEKPVSYWKMPTLETFHPKGDSNF